MKEPHDTIPHFFDLLEYRQMFWLKIFSSNVIHKSVSDNVTEVKRFYHMNYGVIQGFAALRKAVKTYVWYRQSAADTSLAFGATQWGWCMSSKAFILLNPRSFVEIFRILAAKVLKNPYHLQATALKLF